MMKRKPGISAEEFRDYYENKHVKLFTKYMEMPGLEHYVRRYLTPFPGLMTGTSMDSGYDVIMEVWFTDKELFEVFRDGKEDQAFRDMVVQDELNFIDRESMSFNIVEECVTK